MQLDLFLRFFLGLFYAVFTPFCQGTKRGETALFFFSFFNGLPEGVKINENQGVKSCESLVLHEEFV
jgi:hypothetical protein